jgi:hypothetical protein
MNNIKMSELMVGTWLHHWFPRTHCQIKYYKAHTYHMLHYLLTNVLFCQFDHRVLQKYCHGQSY